MAVEADIVVADYVLSVVASLGLLGNLLLFVYRIGTFPKGFTIVMKYFMLFLDASYFLQGLALLLFVLWNVTEANILCQTGGYFVMFSSQMTVCFLVSGSLLILLWRFGRVTPDSEKRHGVVFIGVVLLQFVAISFLTFMPLTDSLLFNNNDTTPFTCLPVRLVGQKGWQFSVTTLAAQWISIGLGLGSNMTAILRTSRDSSSSSEQTSPLQEAKRISIALFIETACWIAVLAIFSYAYFLSPVNEHVIWTLVLYSSGLNVLHPILHLVCGPRRPIFCASRSGHPLQGRKHRFQFDAPGSLTSVIKIADRSSNCKLFRVQWAGEFSTETGLLKVYSRSHYDKWKTEKDALMILSQQVNKNVAKCQWFCKTNKFKSALFKAAVDMTLDRKDRLICVEYAKHGNLRQFLQSKIDKVTETMVQSMSSDIANGLHHVHELGIFHNKLTSSSLSVIGFGHQTMDRCPKIVIGDFDEASNSETEDETQHQAVQPNRHLAPFDGEGDIRSYSLVLLEMMASLSRHRVRTTSRLPGNAAGSSSPGNLTSTPIHNTNVTKKKWEIPIAKRKLPLIPLVKSGRESVLSDLEGEIDVLLHSGFEPRTNNKPRTLSNNTRELSPIVSPSTVTRISTMGAPFSVAPTPRSKELTMSVDCLIANVHKMSFDAYKICYDTTSVANINLDELDEKKEVTKTPKRRLPPIPTKSSRVLKQPLRSEAQKEREFEIECWEEATNDQTVDSGVQLMADMAAHAKCRRLDSTLSTVSRDSGIGAPFDDNDKSPEVFHNIPRNRRTIYAPSCVDAENKLSLSRGSFSRKHPKIFRRMTRESISSIDSGFSHGQHSDYYRSNLSTTDSFLSTCIKEVDQELSDEDIYSTIDEASSCDQYEQPLKGSTSSLESTMPKVGLASCSINDKSQQTFDEESDMLCFYNEAFTSETCSNVKMPECSARSTTPIGRQLPTPKRQVKENTMGNICEECHIDEHFLNHPLATVKPVKLCEHNDDIHQQEESKSVSSLILDSGILIDRFQQDSIRIELYQDAFNRPTEKPKRCDSQRPLKYCKELSGMFLEVDYKTLVESDGDKMRTMMNNIVDRGSMDAISKQITDVVIETWIATPPPSAASILQGLKRVLPKVPNSSRARTTTAESQA